MLWAYTEQLKQIGCDQETSGRVDFAGAREVQIAELVGCGFLKDCVVVSQIGCVTCGEPHLLARSPNDVFAQDNQAVELWEPMRSKQDRICDAEDRGIHADAKSQRQNSGERVGRGFAQRAKSV